MKVFFDTNIWCSALGTRGLCSDLVREVLVHHEFYYCDEMLNEVEEKLRDKFGLSKTLIREIVDLIRTEGKLQKEAERMSLKMKDKDDLPIIKKAIKSEVDFFITGDKEILVLKESSGMKFVSPRQFWESLK